MRSKDGVDFEASASPPKLKRLCFPIGVALAFAFSGVSAQASTFSSWKDLKSKNGPGLGAIVSETPAGSDGSEKPLVRHPIFTEGEGQPNGYVEIARSASSGSESQGDKVRPLRRLANQASGALHTIEAFYSGDDMNWAVSGSRYVEVRFSLIGDKGTLKETFSDLDSLRVSVSESSIPDGLYSYALLVVDPAVQGSLASIAASQLGCAEFKDPYGGSQCYMSSFSDKNNGQPVPSVEINTEGNFNHSLFKDTIRVNKGLISSTSSALLE